MIKVVEISKAASQKLADFVSDLKLWSSRN